jgi:hypothetical protein
MGNRTKETNMDPITSYLALAAAVAVAAVFASVASRWL